MERAVRVLGAKESRNGVDKFFTPSELANRWKIDISTIRRRFRCHPRVLKFESKGRIQFRVPADLVAELERQPTA